ncbi:hypothetical protein ACPV4B_02280 [Vibrio parahaemolyticus]|uniref:hypothetical protein n=1 Tax=Vibrio mediterranei TaxID=689 RepID=UPI004067B86B
MEVNRRYTVKMMYVCLIVFVSIFTTLYVTLFEINSDVAFLVYMAKNTGWKELYTDFYEVNPPLIVYLYKLFLAPYNMGLLSDISAIRIGTTIYFLMCLFLMHQLLRVVSKNTLLITFSASLALFTIYPLAYSQREHFVAAGLVVYICNVWSSGVSSQYGLVRLMSTLVAAIGFCLKPQYLLVMFLIEIMMIWRGRVSVRYRDVLFISMWGFFYIFSVYYLNGGYIYTIIPTSLDYYTQYKVSKSELASVASALAIIVLPCYIIIRRNMWESEYVILLGIGIIASLVAYASAGTGFGYHLIPAIILSSTMLYSACIIAIRGLIAGKRTKEIILLISALVPLSFLHAPYLRSLDHFNFNLSVDRFFAINQELTDGMIVADELLLLSEELSQITEEGDGILVLATTAMYPHHAIVMHSKLTWASRFPNFWLLPAEVNYDASSASQQVHIENIRSLVFRDLLAFEPKIIIFAHQKDNSTHSLALLMEDTNIAQKLSTYEFHIKMPADDLDYFIYSNHGSK